MGTFKFRESVDAPWQELPVIGDIYTQDVRPETGGGGFNVAVISTGTTLPHTLDISNYTTSNNFILFFHTKLYSSGTQDRELVYAPWNEEGRQVGLFRESGSNSSGFTDFIAADEATALGNSTFSGSLASYLKISYENGIVNLATGRETSTSRYCFKGDVLLIYGG